MSSTVEVNGEEYEFDDNPSMGTVKEVQNMQMDLLLKYLDEDDLRGMDSFDESEFLSMVIEEEGMEAVNDMIWGRNILTAAQTISLATDEIFDVDEVEDMGAKDFQRILEAAEEQLGGDADDFFERLNVGTSLTESQARQVQSQSR